MHAVAMAPLQLVRGTPDSAIPLDGWFDVWAEHAAAPLSSWRPAFQSTSHLVGLSIMLQLHHWCSLHACQYIVSLHGHGQTLLSPKLFLEKLRDKKVWLGQSDPDFLIPLSFSSWGIRKSDKASLTQTLLSPKFFLPEKLGDKKVWPAGETTYWHIQANLRDFYPQ